MAAAFELVEDRVLAGAGRSGEYDEEWSAVHTGSIGDTPARLEAQSRRVS
jgi:hypothetical protein